MTANYLGKNFDKRLSKTRQNSNSRPKSFFYSSIPPKLVDFFKVIDK